MVKVAIFVPSMTGGGAERAMMNLANNFVSRDISVDLVLVEALGAYLASVDSRVRIVNLNCGRLAKSILRLAKYYQKNQPTVILSALDDANVVSLLAKKIACMPTRHFVSVHTSIRSTMCSSRRSPVKEVVFRLMQIMYPSADGVITVSEGVKEDIIKLVGVADDRVHKIYNPITTDSINDMAREPLDHPWFTDSGIPVVLSVGRLTGVKDYQTLIKAFGNVVRNRECRLVILGDGEKREELESLIDAMGLKECVLLPGFQQNPFKWMSRAALFVLSSKLEGLPNVLIEAMACGVPIVSTDCFSGPNEILEDGRWGKLVPVGDVDAMTDAIIDVLDNGSSVDVKERAAHFTIDRAVEAYLDVLLGRC